MPNHLIFNSEANLYVKPSVFSPKDTYTQTSIGDLHGNAMKLMYFLVEQGIVDTKDYNTLKRIYLQNPLQLTQRDIQQFDIIIELLKIKKPNILVRFIGDMLADRGQLDYFTLRILQKLKQSGVRFEIILSNHDMEFIRAYEEGGKLKASTIRPQQTRSMANLQTLIDKEIIERSTIDDIIKNTYLPALKLLSYSLESNKISIYSHAPINVACIEALAQYMGVAFDDSTAVQLASTIDAINEKFKNIPKIHKLINNNAAKELDFKQDPVNYIIWNRNTKIDRNPNHKGYKIDYIHGHTRGPTKGNIYNLDTDLGKMVLIPARLIDSYKGRYCALASTGQTLEQRKKMQFLANQPLRTDFENKFKAQLTVIQEKTQELLKRDNYKLCFEKPNEKQKKKNIYLAIEHEGDKVKLTYDLLTSSNEHITGDISNLNGALTEFTLSDVSQLKLFKNDVWQLVTNQIMTNADQLAHLTGASKTACELYCNLSTNFETYKKDNNFSDFKQKCGNHIAQAKPTLEKHRGWKQVFADIVNLFIAASTVLLANLVGGKFRFLKPLTDSAKKLTETEKMINNEEENLISQREIQVP